MTLAGRRLVVGTRGSKLALAQTRWVGDQLIRAGIIERFETKVIQTAGDATEAAPRGDGAFVKEIERALLNEEIDLAIHSLKDLPTDDTPGLLVAAIPAREDPRDCMVGSTLANLKRGARVGTGSPRRAARLRRLRSDLQPVPVRGNVPTRINKVTSGEVDAVVLAVAGLRRLALEDPGEIFDVGSFLPAPGQGALALQIRQGDPALEAIAAIDDPDTRAAVIGEREVLRQLGGGCMLPLGAFGSVESGVLTVVAAAVADDGSSEVRASGYGDPGLATAIAAHVAESLAKDGALELMKVKR